MSSSPQNRDGVTTPPPRSTVVLLLVDIADTTWRMFLGPIIGGLVGWWADNTWQLFPWLSIAGVVLGCGLTAVLIKQLLKKVGNAQ